MEPRPVRKLRIARECPVGRVDRAVKGNGVVKADRDAVGTIDNFFCADLWRLSDFQRSF